MKLIILLCLAAFAAAETALTAENYYGYDFKPTDAVYNNPVPFTQTLKQKIKSWADRFPAIKSMLSEKTTVLPVELKRVTNNGYTYYSQSASMQAVEAVSGNNFDAFTNYLVDTLQIPNGPEREHFLASMKLVKFSENKDWRMIDIIFSTKSGANCKYACVLGHRDSERNTYDFVIADFKTSFQLAPDIVIIEERRSYLWGLIQTANIRVQKIPANLKQQDIEVLKMFFSQAAMTRFAKMLDVNVPGAFEDAPFLDPMTIMGMVSAGMGIVQNIFNLFKTTSTSKIIKEIVGEGFSRYTQNSKTSIMEGMAADSVKTDLIPFIPRILQLTPEVNEGVEVALKLGLLLEKNVFNDYKIAFSQNKTSNRVYFVDVVISRRDDDKFNIILVNVNQVFALAPNVQYIQHSKSYIGGLYTKTKIERKEYPRTLTQNDMDVLMGFFHITVFRRLATQYGVTVPPMPDKPQLK